MLRARSPASQPSAPWRGARAQSCSTGPRGSEPSRPKAVQLLGHCRLQNGPVAWFCDGAGEGGFLPPVGRVLKFGMPSQWWGWKPVLHPKLEMLERHSWGMNEWFHLHPREGFPKKRQPLWRATSRTHASGLPVIYRV